MIFNLEQSVSILRAIAEGEPDTKLSPVLNAAVPSLVMRGWLHIRGCSDGNYVELTGKGREILGKIL